MAKFYLASVLLITILLVPNLGKPIDKKGAKRPPFLTNVEISALLTCVPSSKFKTISSFLNFNTEATCEDVSLLNSDISANGTIGFEVIQIPFSSSSPSNNRQIRDGFFPEKAKDFISLELSETLREQEVNGTISYGHCSGDNMLSEHVSIGDAGSCSIEKKVSRLTTIFSVIRIRGKCHSFCSGLTTMKLSPTFN